MNPVINRYLSTWQYGSTQSFQNMDIIPIFADSHGGPEYVTLKEALEENFITITELSQSGSVPELKVINTSAHLVLLLDGEELVGAKQNRVLNTTVLLKGNSETIIPVSCTEHGRWSYESETLADSDAMLAGKVRSRKVRSVSASLRQSEGFRSDQGGVWDGIAEMHAKAKIRSATGAMKDVYLSQEAKLKDYARSFAYVPNQQGIIAFIDGDVVGMDLLSRKESFQKIHPKLIKSYAMDAILGGEKKPATERAVEAAPFMKEIADLKESRFTSIGLGEDYRFAGKKSIGSALVFEENLIHLAFFRSDELTNNGRMSRLSHRRGFRGSRSEIVE